jgi:hypothetical protein
MIQRKTNNDGRQAIRLGDEKCSIWKKKIKTLTFKSKHSLYNKINMDIRIGDMTDTVINYKKRLP